MIIKSISFMLYTIFIFLIVSCSLLIKNTKEIKKAYTKQEYEIIQQKEEFIKNSDAFLIHKMKKDVISNYINLPTLSKNMIFIIPVDGVLSKIHYIINSENKKINIKYYLLSGIEYFYDKVNKEILIIYNLPFSYFLENNIVFNTKIVGSLNNKIIEKNIIFDFTYNFMQKAKYLNQYTNNPSFKKTTFYDKNLDSYTKEKLQEEARRVNIKRFSKKYQDLYKKVSKN